MQRTRTRLASSHLKNTDNQKIKSIRRAIKTRAMFCSHYFPYTAWRRQNENWTWQGASALYADSGSSKPSAFDKSCHHIMTMTNVSLLQDYFWHWKWEERSLHFRTTSCRQRYRIPTSWMLNECSRWLHALSSYHYSTCPFESLRSPLRDRQTPEKNPGSSFPATPEKRGLGMGKKKKKRVKDSFAPWRSLSLTVLDNTHFRRKCAEALFKNSKEGRGARFLQRREEVVDFLFFLFVCSS